MKPNVILIYADDLGRGMLSCYSQRYIKTRNIDRISKEGIKFYNAYGTSFCAPARASLLCGIHDAKPGRWSYNRGGQLFDVDQGNVSFEEVMESVNNINMTSKEEGFLAEVFKENGYFTAQIGKLEWGFVTSNETLENHGWDYHYGYYDHERCHGYYPSYIFENGKKIIFEENTEVYCGRGSYCFEKTYHDPYDMSGRKMYSQDLFDEKIREIIIEHKDEPFFLYHPSQLPHGPVFFNKIYEEIENNDKLTMIEKEYASMVLRLDESVGKILDLVDELEIARNTMIIFCSDNGHGIPYIQKNHTDVVENKFGKIIDDIDTPVRSEECGDVFNGNDGMAGVKCSNWEGGIRIPILIRWPEVIKKGIESKSLVACYDMMATFREILGMPQNPKKDGTSFLSQLKGNEKCDKRYVFCGSPIGPTIISNDGYKLRLILNKKKILDYGCFDEKLDNLSEAYHLRLYDLKKDYQERYNIINECGNKKEELLKELLKACGGNLVNGLSQAHYVTYR